MTLDYFSDMSDYLYEKEIKIVTFFDSTYPSNLKKSATVRFQPPLLLFVKGKLEINGKVVAIVGTRNATEYAKGKAREFAVQLANDGYTIVSGLAKGIDREAHIGALSTQEGQTIATLAWLEPVYPPEHTELSKKIEKRGAVISEILERPRNSTYTYGRSRFVIRNRIISGLSNFVIAVESGADGGTIRQVEFACSQNKPVYTLEPLDKSDEDKMKGFVRMYEMGAKPIRTLDDLSNLKLYQQSKLDNM